MASGTDASVYLYARSICFGVPFCGIRKTYCYTPGKTFWGISFVRGTSQGRKPPADGDVALTESENRSKGVEYVYRIDFEDSDIEVAKLRDINSSETDENQTRGDTGKTERQRGKTDGATSAGEAGKVRGSNTPP